MKTFTPYDRINQLVRRVTRRLATDLSASNVGMTVPYRDAPR